MEEAPKIPVQCSVENCRYNRNHMCQAEILEVVAMGDGIAESSLGTCCFTFKKADAE